MKKVMIIALVIFCSLPSLFGALRLGVEGGNPSLVLNIRPEPFDFKIGWNFQQSTFGNGYNFIHISGDYRIIDSYRLVDVVHFFLSLGVYCQLYTDSQNSSAFNFGPRLPIGISILLMNKMIELYAEYAFVLSVLPSFAWECRGQGYLGFSIKTPW
jgi:hypothetical protein